MASIERTAVVAYTARQMYELVNDIERYPEFLPWCASAEVYSRSETELHATMVLAMAGLSHSLSTRNTMEPGKSIALALVDGPFSDLTGLWRFEPNVNAGCLVSLQMDFEFGSRLVAISFGKLFDRIANSMVGAFCKQAEQCYASD